MIVHGRHLIYKILPVGIGYCVHIVKATGSDFVRNNGKLLSVQKINFFGKFLRLYSPE
jgi:hypothetical protein